MPTMFRTTPSVPAALLSALLGALSLPAQAAPAPLPLHVTSATVRAVPPSIRETAAYLTLKNPTAKPIRLVGATAAVAGHSMLMKTHQDGSMMSMLEVKSLTVPAGGTLKMSPSGDHVMLMKLRRPLKPGETIKLLLKADDGRTLSVGAVVKRP